MKISKGERNISVNLTAEENLAEKLDKKRGNTEEKKNSIYAGDINVLKQSDKVAEKKIKTQRQVLKTIMKAYDVDEKIDNMEEEQLNTNKELKAEAGEAAAEISSLDELKKQAQETYKITEDSQEQKDLELLQKQRDILGGKTTEVLTEEEQARLDQMGPMTDYQKEILNFDEMQEVWEERYNKSADEVKSNNRAISATEVERLKSSPMVTAAKEAEKIMKSASKEIIGMLKDDAVKHIDEKFEEEKKKAEEIKEKKEEEEAKRQEEIESQKPEENMKTAAKTDEVQDRLEAELKRIQNEVLGEDIKGLKVDKQI